MKRQTIKEIKECNERDRQIVFNPEIIALKKEANQIDRNARKRINKLRAKIDQMQAECTHVYNYNLSFSCLKCGLMSED